MTTLILVYALITTAMLGIVVFDPHSQDAPPAVYVLILAWPVALVVSAVLGLRRTMIADAGQDGT